MFWTIPECLARQRRLLWQARMKQRQRIGPFRAASAATTTIALQGTLVDADRATVYQTTAVSSCPRAAGINPDQ